MDTSLWASSDTNFAPYSQGNEAGLNYDSSLQDVNFIRLPFAWGNTVTGNQNGFFNITTPLSVFDDSNYDPSTVQTYINEAYRNAFITGVNQMLTEYPNKIIMLDLHCYRKWQVSAVVYYVTPIQMSNIWITILMSMMGSLPGGGLPDGVTPIDFANNLRIFLELQNEPAAGQFDASGNIDWTKEALAWDWSYWNESICRIRNMGIKNKLVLGASQNGPGKFVTYNTDDGPGGWNGNTPNAVNYGFAQINPIEIIECEAECEAEPSYSEPEFIYKTGLSEMKSQDPDSNLCITLHNYVDRGNGSGLNTSQQLDSSTCKQIYTQVLYYPDSSTPIFDGLIEATMDLAESVGLDIILGEIGVPGEGSDSNLQNGYNSFNFVLGSGFLARSTYLASNCSNILSTGCGGKILGYNQWTSAALPNSDDHSYNQAVIENTVYNKTTPIGTITQAVDPATPIGLYWTSSPELGPTEVDIASSDTNIINDSIGNVYYFAYDPGTTNTPSYKLANYSSNSVLQITYNSYANAGLVQPIYLSRIPRNSQVECEAESEAECETDIYIINDDTPIEEFPFTITVSGRIFTLYNGDVLCEPEPEA